jgi:hypothetical protein
VPLIGFEDPGDRGNLFRVLFTNGHKVHVEALLNQKTVRVHKTVQDAQRERDNTLQKVVHYPLDRPAPA